MFACIFYHRSPKTFNFAEDKTAAFPAVMLICSRRRLCREKLQLSEQRTALPPLLTKAHFVSLFLPSSFPSSERSVLLDRSMLSAASLPETSQQPASLIHECALSTRCCEALRRRIHVQLLWVRTKEYCNNEIRVV